MAVADRPGLIKMYGEGTGASLLRGWAGATSPAETLVPATTLDSLIGGRLAARRSLILVDIEGAEHQMLAGASAVIRETPKPLWLIEVTVDEQQPQRAQINPHLRSTFELFWRSGYRSFTATRQPRPVTESDIAAVLSAKTNILGAHNFLFIDANRVDAVLLDIARS